MFCKYETTLELAVFFWSGLGGQKVYTTLSEMTQQRNVVNTITNKAKNSLPSSVAQYCCAIHTSRRFSRQTQQM